jgi:hypothetical protein
VNDGGMPLHSMARFKRDRIALMLQNRLRFKHRTAFQPGQPLDLRLGRGLSGARGRSCKPRAT